MQLFVAQANVDRYRQMLSEDLPPSSRLTLNHLLLEARRDLALLSAGRLGLVGPGAPSGLALGGGPADALAAFEGLSIPTLLLSPHAGLRVVDLNGAYAAATSLDRNRAGGERLFDLFPDNPDDAEADGVANLYASLRRAAEGGRADVMPLQRYDVRQDGVFVTRYWRPVNTPLFDDRDRLRYIAHQVEDVTAQVLGGGA